MASNSFGTDMISMKVCGENQTLVTEFLLLGLQSYAGIKNLLFTFFLMIYSMILIGNFLIIGLVSVSNMLSSPMYFFLSNLSADEIIFTTNIVPKMLQILQDTEGYMSTTSCFLQFFVFCVVATAECLLLAIMSYDRFLAICFPFHYLSIMNPSCCVHLIIGCWSGSFMSVLGTYILICQLQFCGSNVIDHFFCDFAPILRISSSDTSLLEIESFCFSFSNTFFPFGFIIVTYCYIIVTILKIPSVAGRQKAFSTCSSHLTVVSAYYGTLMIMYVTPAKGLPFNKFLSLLYTLVTPLLNPIIYSLRNQEIKKALRSFLFRNNI
ncbi:olfactory receptor 10A7-like [Bombina bombina]|uniref:olfactory receptor 10A7-like n=1 Tax=Bombina bombina TaxID=8345 RepID=UPI00235AE4D1|nr:olfactory receptor 10A7-like [Bombina bombina]